MSLKLKALGLGLLAAMAMSAVAVVNAGATVNETSHFTSDSTTNATTTLTGSESKAPDFTHKMEFRAVGLPGEPIYCNNATFHGTVTANTTQTIEVAPTYSECTTTPSPEGAPVTVHVNGCKFHFASRSTGDATAGLRCPDSKKIEITDPSTGCKLSFGTQTIANAVKYDAVDHTTGGVTKDAITLTSTATNIHFTAHNGLCLFIATTHTTGSLEGAATVHGADLNGNLVNITHT